MPFPPMFPPLGYADHMGRFPGVLRGPHVSGAPDVQGFRGRAMDPKRKGKGFHDNREEDHMHAGMVCMAFSFNIRLYSCF
jgi:hypothetical protein